VLAQAERLHQDMLTDRLAASVAKREELRRDHHRAFDAYIASSWMRTRNQARERSRDRSPEHDIDIDE
jgi:hypothetical protein